MPKKQILTGDSHPKTHGSSYADYTPQLRIDKALECAIGIGFLSGKFMRVTLMLMTFQMGGALAPLVLFPEAIFTSGVYAPTLEGQYIIKNVVLIGAALVLGATVRGGCIVAEPSKLRSGRA
jgi:hypothetical protein